MSKQDQLQILRVLSSVESLLMASRSVKEIPDYIFEQIGDICEKLEESILKDAQNNM